ncbi:MAG TPA: hypothetical protein PLO61_10960 [Fimbriimonadaceae bacterium]|nr:hypothetical protein [Fimbriimonadaceae bacterium]HRJ32128.1 hypothetical protein [Fimbriimonadaceae bacterium]
MRTYRSSRLASPDPHAGWDTALEHFFWDRLEPAFEEALHAGIGVQGQFSIWLRVIEAEYRTRVSSQIESLATWLDLEYVPEEVGEHVEILKGLVLQGCQEAARHLDFAHGTKVLVSVLALETQAPWLEGRFGYFEDKYPYDKICVPPIYRENPVEFLRTIRHEYAHAINLQLSEGKTPRWLDEAIAMVVASESDAEARDAFLRGQAPWRDPHDLDRAFQIHQADVDRQSQLWYAYQQSAWLGRYLEQIEGEHKLTLLLRAFSNNDFWTDLKLRLLRRDPADEALTETYGISESKLFSQAFEWLGSSEAQIASS